MKWLADENLDNDIVRGILRQSPGVDIVRTQDIQEISGRDDVALLAWASKNDRVLLTHDLSSMMPAQREHLRQTGHCSPIIMIPASFSIGAAIEEILLLEFYAVESDWTAGVIYLPLG